MTQDEIIEMGVQAGIQREVLMLGRNLELLINFAKLVAEKATEEANARANASWTLMCKKMVAAEREACAKLFDDRDNGIGFYEPHEPAEIIRARGQE